MKRKINKEQLVIDIIVMLITMLFFYASIVKLLDYETFKVQIGKSPLIMDFSNSLAWLVPGTEIVAAIMLLLPVTRVLGFFFSFTIMLAFTLYIAYMLLFSPYLPCSCGGVLSHMGWTEHLVFNIIFTILPVAGLVLTNHTKDEELETAIN
jgi:uncharacterized membrane protein YphA (DoxX/SURF4 family)